MVVTDLQPRATAGSFLSELPASSLLLTLYCDYWYASAEYVPSRALVALLEALGVNEPAGRAALSRLARRGWLEGRKQGRRTAYRVTPARLPVVLAEGERTVRFGADPWPWDGRWTCVAFSVPEADRHLRPVLRRRLRRLGLGPLYDGLWITPRAPLAAIDRVLTELAIDDAAVFRVAEVPRPAGIGLIGAWDLPALRAAYDDLARRLGPRVVVCQTATPGTELALGIVRDPALEREISFKEDRCFLCRDNFWMRVQHLLKQRRPGARMATQECQPARSFE